MHDRELDGDDLTGLPERIEPDDTEVVVDPPPKLLRRSESGAIGPLYGVQAAHELAETARSGSRGVRWKARGLAWFFFMAIVGIPIIMLVALGLSRLF